MFATVDLDYATATELTRAIGDRSLSSRELLDHLRARIERHNPDLNAIVALDLDRAVATAAAADQATADGGPIGPLHGLPMTVKDVWETEGLVTTSGAPELQDHVPEVDALAVARLRTAGAVIFGKTNTPLYAGDFQTYNDVYGVTNNPWDTTRTAGGSSGGAAAAVAAGLTPLELGSDIGGSIRNPAHFNGVYGLKPSWGVVPSRGHIPGPPGSLVEPDVNCNGPLARSLDDLRLALGVVAGPVPEDAAGWRLELDEGPPVADVGALRVATVSGRVATWCPWPPMSAPHSTGSGSDWPTPEPVSMRSSCRSPSTRASSRGRNWCARSWAWACPMRPTPRLPGSRAVPGDDPMLDRRARPRRPLPELGPGQRAPPAPAGRLGRVVRAVRRGAGSGHADRCLPP